MGEKIELFAEKLVYGGTAIAHSEGKTFFVYGALPGERVLAEVLGKRKGVWFCETVEVLGEPSEARTKPQCPHFGACGGCTWQHIEYQHQLRFKKEILAETLQRIGKFAGFAPEEVIPSPLQWGYRNKMEFTFGKGESGVFIGLHRRGSFRELLPVAKDCLLVGEEVRSVCAAVEEMSQGEAPYDPIAKTGYLRFLTVRKSWFEKKLTLGITVTQRTQTDVFGFWFEELGRRFPNLIAGGYVVLNPAGSSSQGEVIATFGETQLKERLGEKEYIVSAMSFFQTNPLGAKALYDVVRSAAGSGDTAWDLYCGIGAIGIYIADGFNTVLGVEFDEAAVELARRNAQLNGIASAKFVAGDVKKVLWELRESGSPRPDVVVVDPPRAGVPKKAIERLMGFSPPRIIYVSCNPTTLARDCNLIAQQGYRLTSVQPVDMFPQTYHIESVAVLEREK